MTKALDRLTLLETFVRIAERGTISAAARDLGVSQASASRQLSDLEQRLGVELIARTTHSLSLTKAGETCLKEARVLLADWDGFAERFADEAESLSGPLKIVVPIALGQTIALDCAIAFQKAHPGIVLDWILEDRPIRFSEMGCDLWIRIGDVPDETLIVQPISTVERLIVAAPGLLPVAAKPDPATLEDLPCLALSPFEGGQIPLRAKDGKSLDLKAGVAFSSNDIFAIRRGARSGAGYAVLPHWLVAQDLEEGTLIDVLPDWRAPSLTINAAYAPSRRQTRRLKLFLETISEALRAPQTRGSTSRWE